MLVGVLPRLLIVTSSRCLSSRRIAHLFPASANPFWPWGAASHCMLGLSSGAWPHRRCGYARRLDGGRLSVRTLAVHAQLALRLPGSPSHRRRRQRAPLRRTAIPHCPRCSCPIRSPPSSKRNSARWSARRASALVFVMGFSFGLVVWLPMMLRGRVEHSAISGNFLVVVSLYALFLLAQVTYGNAFGFDRSAAQLYFFAPVSISRALAGKNIAAAIFIFLEVAAVAAACSLLRLGISSGPDRRGVSGHRHRRVLSVGRRQFEFRELPACP